ncbi:MAG TPA: hypothetical protein VGT08_01805 [Terracidiphilus sp.]|nr:hypothetical protein [Terracidiphilus sp.]
MRVLQRIFSFPVMLAGLLVLLAVLTVRGRFDDPDLWWHLKMGQIIWTTHSIPANDIFSYTTNHQALIPQEWLSQVVIYGAYLCGGCSGMMLWLSAMSALLLVAGYGLCWLYSGNAKVAFVGALIIWFFATIGFSIRPQMISYILLVAELLLIYAGRTRNPRWFFWLPVVFIVWINCHASFILGIVVAGVYLFSSFFNFEMGSLVSRRWDPQCRRTLVWALIVSAAGLFLNPGGIKQILYPFDTLMNMHILMANVEEWAPVQLNESRGIGLMVVVLCCLLLAVVRRSELFLDELLLMALGTWLAASHMRMLVIFGILAAPILSRQLANSWEGYEIDNDRIGPNAVFIGISLLAAFLAFPDHQNLIKQVEAESPVKAVEYIKANHLSGPMLNSYEFGGYLIWAAPEYPVMMDGRTDVYEWSGFLGEFGKWATLQSDPNLLLQKYKVNFCLLTAQSPMVHVLLLLHEWKMVYSDYNSVIFVRTTAAGQVE